MTCPRRFALAVLIASLASSTGAAESERSTPAWPAPPFRAELPEGTAYVRLAPDARSPTVGLLRVHDRVTVTACVPDCAARGAWALLGDDGAIKLSLLRPLPDDAAGAPGEAGVRYRYGRVKDGGVAVRRAPDAAAPVFARHLAGQDLAFRVDDALLARGWLERPYGGFVPTSRIELATPSAFTGVRDPTLPLVLTHDRLARTARARARPAGVPAGARWVHVDLRRQTLVAYEGDRPAYATLVSTGRKDFETRRGLYRVYHKVIHGLMHGDDPKPYFVDEVPFVHYLRRGIALHGTFWHDRFGRRISHGCINLSFADAEWLFDWAPPRLPDGWHAIWPRPRGASLWVLVER